MGDELVGKEEDGFQGEFVVVEVEQIFEIGIKKVEDYGVVVVFGVKLVNEGNVNFIGK